MKKLLIVVTAAVLFLAGITGISFAMTCCAADRSGAGHSGLAHAEETDEVKKAVEVGNTVCPVGGETIKESSKATYEYKGKVYNFCCPDCIPAFKANPEKYIDQLSEKHEAVHEHTH